MFARVYMQLKVSGASQVNIKTVIGVTTLKAIAQRSGKYARGCARYHN